MSSLGRWSLRVIRAIARTLFDDGAGVPPDRLDWLVRDYADFTAHVGAKTRWAFRASLLALELLPLFVIGVPLPMSFLSPHARARYLGRLESSRFAFLVVAVKAPLTMIWFEHADALPSTGYDARPLLELEDPEREGRAVSKAGPLRVLPRTAP